MPSQYRIPASESRDRNRHPPRSPLSLSSTNRSLPGGGGETLPSIKDILPDIDRPRTNVREPSQHLRHNPEGPSRTSTIRPHLSPPISPAQPPDRRPSIDGYDGYPLPIRNSLSAERANTAPSSGRWLDQQARSSAGQPAYTVHAPVPRGAPSPSYSYSSHSPEPSRNGGSNLPPPPVYQYGSTNGRSSYPAQYSTSSNYANGHAYYPNDQYEEAHFRGRSGPGGPPHMHASSSTSARPQYEQHSSHPQYPPANSVYSSSHPPPQGYQYYDTREPEPTRKRRGNLPRYVTDMLKQWFLEHIAHPYPTEQEKNELCRATGLGMTQISNWFINARRRQAPALQMQARAETRLRENSGGSNSNSD